MQHKVLTVEDVVVAVEDKLRKIAAASIKSPSDCYPLNPDVSHEIDQFITYNKNHILTKLRGLTEQLIREIANHEGDKPFRVLEVGCGSNLQLVTLTEVVAEKLGKKIEYVGIDIGKTGINELTGLTKDHLTSSTFICHDASDIAWFQMESVAKQPFHAVIMMNPIVENPFKGAINSRKSRGMTEEDMEFFKEEVQWNPNFHHLYTQYCAFKKIFREVLPICLEPNAAMLIRVFHPVEYKGLLKLTQPLVAEELPSYEKARELNFCLIAKFNPACQQKLQEKPRRTF